MSEKRASLPESEDQHESPPESKTTASNSFRTPDYFDHAWGRLSKVLARPITDRWQIPAAALLICCGFAAALASSPSVYINHHVWDLFVPLDGAWRMANGQWPHADFSTPIGIVYYLLLGAAAGLVGPGAKVLIWSQLLFLPVTLLFAFATSRNRLIGSMRLLYLLFIGLITISPRSLDYPATLNFTANYNRFSWALICIIIVSSFIEPKKRSRQQALAEILALSTTLLLLFFLKISFFLVAACLLLVAIVGSQPNRRVAISSLGIGFMAIGFCFLIGEVAWQYQADIQSVASTATRHGGLLRTTRLTEIVFINLSRIVGITAFLLWFIRSSRSQSELNEATRATLLITAAMVLLFGATIQVHDRHMLGLAVLGLCCFRPLQARQQQRGVATTYKSLSVLGIAAIGLLVVPITLEGSAIVQHRFAAGSNANSVPWSDDPQSPLFSIRFSRPTQEEVEKLAACDLKAGLSKHKNSRAPCDLTWKLMLPFLTQDAVTLLKRNQADKSRIASFTFSQMFPWLLKQQAPPGIHAWYDYGRTFDEHTFEDDPDALKGADFVLVPNTATNQVIGFPFEHEHTLKDRFQLIDTTLHWELWGQLQPQVE